MHYKKNLIPLLCLILIVAIVLTAIINLNTGFLSLHLQDFFQDSANSQIAEIRVNRVLVMLLAGISIPTSGFLMQEYFQNPLAGPDILGITSVASLSVAFYIFFSHDILIPE
ncbi:MAG: ABC transporter permease, partial [Flavobacterium psychrophilum]